MARVAPYRQPGTPDAIAPREDASSVDQADELAPLIGEARIADPEPTESRAKAHLSTVAAVSVPLAGVAWLEHRFVATACLAIGSLALSLAATFIRRRGSRDDDS